MMETTRFHEWRTFWEKMPLDRNRFGGWKPFYEALCAELEYGEISHTVACMEAAWCTLGRPYYKLWPGYAVMLSKTKLNIPGSVFRSPHVAFCIRLPREPVLFGQYEHEGTVRQLKSIIATRGPSEKTKSDMFAITIDDGRDQRHTPLSMSMCVNPDNTLGESFDKLEWQGESPPEMQSMLRTAMQIAVAVSMLATSAHRCVEHDVLAALRERYDAAKTDEERQELAERSERKGIKGWNIGRGRCLSLTTQHGDTSEGGGRELSYQHVRGGHFHTVCHGAGREQRKVMFFEPTIVRPDLPVAPVFAEAM